MGVKSKCDLSSPWADQKPSRRHIYTTASKYYYWLTRSDFCCSGSVGQPQALQLLRLTISSGIVVGKAIVKKIQGSIAQLVVARILHDIPPASWPWKVNRHHFANTSCWTIGHHHQSIS